MLNIFTDQHNLFCWWLPACGKNTLMYFFQSMDGLTMNWFDIECLFSISSQINFQMTVSLLSHIISKHSYVVTISNPNINRFPDLFLFTKSGERSQLWEKWYTFQGYSRTQYSHAFSGNILSCYFDLVIELHRPWQIPYYTHKQSSLRQMKIISNTSNSPFAIRTIIRPHPE